MSATAPPPVISAAARVCDVLHLRQQIFALAEPKQQPVLLCLDKSSFSTGVDVLWGGRWIDEGWLTSVRDKCRLRVYRSAIKKLYKRVHFRDAVTPHDVIETVDLCPKLRTVHFDTSVLQIQVDVHRRRIRLARYYSDTRLADPDLTPAIFGLPIKSFSGAWKREYIMDSCMALSGLLGVWADPAAGHVMHAASGVRVRYLKVASLPARPRSSSTLAPFERLRISIYTASEAVKFFDTFPYPSRELELVVGSTIFNPSGGFEALTGDDWHKVYRCCPAVHFIFDTPLLLGPQAAHAFGAITTLPDWSTNARTSSALQSVKLTIREDAAISESDYNLVELVPAMRGIAFCLLGLFAPLETDAVGRVTPHRCEIRQSGGLYWLRALIEGMVEMLAEIVRQVAKEEKMQVEVSVINPNRKLLEKELAMG